VKSKLFAKHIYSKIIPYEYRRSSSFRRKYEFLLSSSHWEREQQILYQEKAIKETLLRSFQSRYYSDNYKVLKIDRTDIERSSDIYRLLAELPITTKAAVKQSVESFLLPNQGNYKKYKKNTTSGSTGEPLVYFNSKNCMEWEEAFYQRHLVNNGYKFGNSVIYVRTYVPKAGQPLSYYDPQWKILWFSAYHMTNSNLGIYIDAIRKSKIKTIIGYPSSLIILANYCVTTGEPLEMDTVITASEALIDDHRQIIQNAFGAKVGEFYGLSERVVIMGKCQHSNQYHDYPEYGYYEILDAGGNQVTKEGEIGEIIGTNFTNSDCLPWIRYKTGDLATIGRDCDCDCGVKSRLYVKDIIGRTEDYLIGEGGKKLPGVNIYSVFKKYYGEINQFAIYQNELDRVSISIVPKYTYNNKVGEHILEDMRLRFGSSTSFEISCVNEIPRSKSGKVTVLKKAKHLEELL
jgi:phenylacetate-CoA ligase